MILIVGGIGSEKRNFANYWLGYDFADMSDSLDDSPVIFDVHELVHEHEVESLLAELTKKRVVICNEVGCGVIPLEPEERLWRERVGRLCCELAKEADEVIRMSCGIPTWLKGAL